MKLKVLSLLLLLQFDSAFVCLFHRMNDGGKSRRWRYLFLFIGFFVLPATGGEPGRMRSKKKKAIYRNDTQ